MIQLVLLRNLPTRTFALLLVIVCVGTALLGIGVAAHAATGELTPTRITSKDLPAGTGSMSAAQCAACHVTEPVLSHPVGIKPSMHTPVALPLENGQMTCTTCHLDSIAQHAAKNGPLLRANAGAAFCAQCHADTALSAAAQHPLATTRAHGTWLKGGPATTPTLSATESVKSCLACHDGTIASDAFGRLNWNRALADPSSINGSNHPVAIPFPQHTAPHSELKLRPPSMLDHRVTLVGGQVACISCHSLYSSQPKLLVMRNDGSALCLSCHAN